MKRALRIVAIVVGVVGVLALGAVWYARRSNTPHPPTYVARDSTLHQPYFYLYPTRLPGSPKALIVLFGNDVAFWEPHQTLAWRFAGEGYSVIGVDLRKYLSTLPEEPQRDSAFGAGIASIIAHARTEMNADSLPVVIGGHSFGAELAFWTALHAPPPKLVGVLSLNTRASGHLFITPADWMNKEASGAYSFSVIDAIKHLDPKVKVALVRSSKDLFRAHDPALMAAGGDRIKRFEIPMATHSMTTMLVAGPLISRAVAYLVDTTTSR